MAVCLIAVVSGKAYEDYAQQLFESAHEHVQLDLRTVLLPGRSGWPDATLYRYHILLEYVSELVGNYLYLCDADMRFEGPVGHEFLGALVATQHPGYVGISRHLPYEDRPESAAYVRRGDTYYAGGFVGGRTNVFLGLAARIKYQIDRDDENGIVARWHDESHLNSILAHYPPTLTLSPAFCYPDDDRAYLPHWPERYERKLVALDKTPAERGER